MILFIAYCKCLLGITYNESIDFDQTSLPEVPRYQACRAGDDYLFKSEAQAAAGLRSNHGTY
jgi:hypothetical protein